jgi:NAD/NADP transhydrogenase alpha subunit
VVQVTSLTATVPETVDVKELESEIVTAVADRLRDDHGYELVVEAGAGDSGTRHEHALHPAGSIIVDKKPGALKVELHGVEVDAHDLFTGVSSELEQRHGGLRAEIG